MDRIVTINSSLCDWLTDMIYGSTLTKQERLALRCASNLNIIFDDFVEVEEDYVEIAGRYSSGEPVILGVQFELVALSGTKTEPVVTYVDEY